jgi:hypothetical protein
MQQHQDALRHVAALKELDELRLAGDIPDQVEKSGIDDRLGHAVIGRDEVDAHKMLREAFLGRDVGYTGENLGEGPRLGQPGSGPTGDLTGGHPGGAGDAVPNGSDKAGYTGGSTISWEEPVPDGEESNETTTHTSSSGNPDPDDDYEQTSTTTTNEDGSSDTTTNTLSNEGEFSTTRSHRNADGSGAAVTRRADGSIVIRKWNTSGHSTYTYRPAPDSQPTPEGSSGWVGGDCGWNPLNGCTKGAVTEASILGKLTQPGPDDEVGNSSTGSGAPNVGTAAVTNRDEQHLRGTGGGGTRIWEAAVDPEEEVPGGPTR